ncbi:MAG: ABC transporter ATP-binding protein [Candidatus Symbiobacter sp.]|nr:ABC transporter ATP-binding protein [Candidatus Symbiobacter sp.]
MLVIRQLKKKFGGVTALDGINVTVATEQIHAIIGPNGAGKTTLFNVICGQYAPSSGSITWHGQEIGGLKPEQLAALGFARTFQNLQICQNMSVIANVMIGAHLQQKTRSPWASMLRLPRLARDEAGLYAESLDLLRSMGLAHQAESPAKSLSYGALRKLEIARGLALRPRVLLLDEPAAGLNHTETNDMTAIIRRIAASGITVILVEHDMKLVMALADHITVLNYGKNLADGDPGTIRSHPEVLAAYLGSEIEAAS